MNVVGSGEGVGMGWMVVTSPLRQLPSSVPILVCSIFA